MRAVLNLLVVVVGVFASSQADAQRAKAPPVVTNPPSAQRLTMPKALRQRTSARPAVPVLTQQVTNRPAPQHDDSSASPSPVVGAVAPAAASTSGSREHLVKTMQQLQATYRQQAILLSQLIPHVQPQQHRDLQNAIARAQASRQKLASQLEKMQTLSSAMVAESAIPAAQATPRTDVPAMTANVPTAQPLPDTTRQQAKYVPQRFPPSKAAPQPIRENAQVSATERIPPQPGDFADLPTQVKQSGSQTFEQIFQGRVTGSTGGNSASPIPATVDDGPVQKISADAP